MPKQRTALRVSAGSDAVVGDIRKDLDLVVLFVARRLVDVTLKFTEPSRKLQVLFVS